LILRGEDTPQTRAVLAGEAERLKAFVNLLPEEDQYEAAMALHARNPRWIDIDKQLIAKAKTTSVFLDPARELLVGDVAAVFHNEINQLLKRAVSGQQLGQAEADLVTHLSALKALTTTEYDAVLTELARESVYQLKDTASGTLRRVSSKLNSMQGAVAQVSFFRSRQFRQFLGDRLNELRGQVREALGSGWTTTAVAEGRIYIAKRLQSGYSLTEFVDGAVVGQEIAAQGRLNRGFVAFSAQVKAEQRVTAWYQNMLDAVRQTPEFASYDAILFIPSGKQYTPLQLVQPPTSITPQRMLIAAPGGKWPSDLNPPAAVAKTVRVKGPLTRDGCRSLGQVLPHEGSREVR